ncbi:hypothetical protein J4E85_011231 [Alternaria conjuncta]|uniref:uncharacterized protein n=1 Tax=Alternaria conjuncta TaxID=181017 RepID=UPI00221E9344|nr:uncharacterized protein J4E85_011231 [Alternaria conjuncta]KAI4911322.1 hypothetical protein J4E85_011231 [Alternaria conjuncta]
MADERSPVAGFSHQENNGFLRVAPTPDMPVDKLQRTSAQPPPPSKTGKRPFGGGEILGEPLIKRSRVDENDEARRSKERRPRELDPAMLTKHFTMANKKEIEEVKARIATATPSNPTGIPPRSTRHAEPVPLSMTTGKPMVSKSLRDAPPLPRDTPSKERRDAMAPPPRENTSKPRQDPSAYQQKRTAGAHRSTPTPTPGTKANPISFSSGLHALDREFRSGSGYYSEQQDDDDALSLLSYLSLSEGPRGPGARRGLGQDGAEKRYGKDSAPPYHKV